ncbi:MAG: branched-chain amino acid ABC transporter permease [Streptosporangiales bacterium]|nr:branched-chain amino acid ABC transporter permease [Streptosporangiales bacterium]MBO0892549.1 branched-chain amino acid ABC transporter permease [Acidothermales bacterium]
MKSPSAAAALNQVDDASGVIGVVDRHRRLLSILVGVVLVVFAGVLLGSGGFYTSLVEDILIYAIAAMGLDFLGGYGGLVSLGQAGFIGLGAYGIAVPEAHGFGPWTSIGIALVVVAATAAVTGIVAIRVTGISFVIITLAIGQILWGLAYRWVSLSGGDNGLVISGFPKLGPLDLTNPQVLAFVILAVFVVVALVLRTLVSSPFGLSMLGIRSNEQRLRTLGYRTGLHRYLAYIIASIVGGVAGILYAFSNNLISPTTMDFSHNGIITLMAVLGGLRSLWGPVLGALIITLIQQELSIYVSRWQMLMGAVFVVVVVFTPDGLWGLMRQGTAALRRRRARAGPGDAARPDAAGTEAGTGQSSATESSESGVR